MYAFFFFFSAAEPQNIILKRHGCVWELEFKLVVNLWSCGWLMLVTMPIS